MDVEILSARDEVLSRYWAMRFRRAIFGIRVFSIDKLVIGELDRLENQDSIEDFSYVCPSIAITGLRISSIVIGQQNSARGEDGVVAAAGVALMHVEVVIAICIGVETGEGIAEVCVHSMDICEMQGIMAQRRR